MEGDPAESQELIDLLTAAGVELTRLGKVERRPGFWHTYGNAQLDGWPAAGTTAAPGSDRRAPYRTTAYIAQRALPAAERRPARRRSR